MEYPFAGSRKPSRKTGRRYAAPPSLPQEEENPTGQGRTKGRLLRQAAFLLRSQTGFLFGRACFRLGGLLFGWRYGITAIGGVTFGGAVFGERASCLAERCSAGAALGGPLFLYGRAGFCAFLKPNRKKVPPRSARRRSFAGKINFCVRRAFLRRKQIFACGGRFCPFACKCAARHV